jgi:hypothetical protein
VRLEPEAFPVLTVFDAQETAPQLEAAELFDAPDHERVAKAVGDRAAGPEPAADRGREELPQVIAGRPPALAVAGEGGLERQLHERQGQPGGENLGQPPVPERHGHFLAPLQAAQQMNPGRGRCGHFGRLLNLCSRSTGRAPTVITAPSRLTPHS